MKQIDADAFFLFAPLIDRIPCHFGGADIGSRQRSTLLVG